MSVKQLNEAKVLDQIEGQYAKLLMIGMLKLGVKHIDITEEDIARVEKEFPGQMPTIFVRGHEDKIEVRILPQAEAEAMAAAHHDAKGTN